MEVVALSGKAGTGKDYLYTAVLKPLGFKRVALADHFKNFIVSRGLASFEEVYVTKPPHIRWMLQQEGTELGRNVYGEDIWCRTLLIWMEHWERTWGMNKFAITDVRFPNEVTFVKAIGRVYRIEAPERAAASPLTAEAKAHVSETALDDYTAFSGVIYNDPRFAATVAAQIYAQLERHDLLTSAEAQLQPSNFQFGV